MNRRDLIKGAVGAAGLSVLPALALPTSANAVDFGENPCASIALESQVFEKLEVRLYYFRSSLVSDGWANVTVIYDFIPEYQEYTLSPDNWNAQLMTLSQIPQAAYRRVVFDGELDDAAQLHIDRIIKSAPFNAWVHHFRGDTLPNQRHAAIMNVQFANNVPSMYDFLTEGVHDDSNLKSIASLVSKVEYARV